MVFAFLLVKVEIDLVFDSLQGEVLEIRLDQEAISARYFRLKASCVLNRLTKISDCVPNIR